MSIFVLKSLVLLSGIELQKARFFVCFWSWLKGLLSILKNHFRESSLGKTFLVTSLSTIWLEVLNTVLNTVLEEFVISSL